MLHLGEFYKKHFANQLLPLLFYMMPFCKLRHFHKRRKLFEFNSKRKRNKNINRQFLTENVNRQLRGEKNSIDDKNDREFV